MFIIQYQETIAKNISDQQSGKLLSKDKVP